MAVAPAVLADDPGFVDAESSPPCTLCASWAPPCAGFGGVRALLCVPIAAVAPDALAAAGMAAATLLTTTTAATGVDGLAAAPLADVPASPPAWSSAPFAAVFFPTGAAVGSAPFCAFAAAAAAVATVAARPELPFPELPGGCAPALSALLFAAFASGPLDFAVVGGAAVPLTDGVAALCAALCAFAVPLLAALPLALLALALSLLR